MTVEVRVTAALQKLDTPLHEGDVLSILPALAGGGR